MDKTDILKRAIAALDSLAGQGGPPSNKSTVSTKHTPALTRTVNGGEQSIYRFRNGYGASVVNSSMAYGGLEAAVIRFNGAEVTDFALAYDTPLTDDVIGGLGAESLNKLLDGIQALPAK